MVLYKKNIQLIINTFFKNDKNGKLLCYIYLKFKNKIIKMFTLPLSA